jgi:hypothetical protein
MAGQALYYYPSSREVAEPTRARNDDTQKGAILQQRRCVPKARALPVVVMQTPLCKSVIAFSTPAAMCRGRSPSPSLGRVAARIDFDHLGANADPNPGNAHEPLTIGILARHRSDLA